MKAIVILVKPHGRTSNNLFQHIHFLCYFHQLNSLYFNHDYLKFTLAKQPNCLIVHFTRILNYPLIRKGLIKFGIASYLNFNRDGSELSRKKLDSNIRGVIYIEGWHFRCHELTRKYKPILINAFKSTYRINHPLLSHIEGDNRVKLAVHIRRGDYKFWLGGQYYYSDIIYQNAIRQFLDLIKKESIVIYFTDDKSFLKESIDTNGVESLLSEGDAWQDYVLMSSCDYIIGPPSTFSMWASYLGSKPLYSIHDPEKGLFDLNQFSVVNG